MQLKINGLRIDIFAILGCLIGIIAIYMGFSILNGETAVSYDDGGMRFGADFYTEIHDVTRDVFISSLRIHETIKMGFGWGLMALGALGFCYFIRKAVTKEPTPPTPPQFPIETPESGLPESPYQDQR